MEAHVDDLQHGQQAEARAGERRRHPPRPRRQDEQDGDGDECLHREAHEHDGRAMSDVVRCGEGEEHEQPGQRGHHPRRDRVPPAAVLGIRHLAGRWATDVVAGRVAGRVAGLLVGTRASGLVAAGSGPIVSRRPAGARERRQSDDLPYGDRTQLTNGRPGGRAARLAFAAR